MIYLATPYSHPDPAVRAWRFQQASALWHNYFTACSTRTTSSTVIFSPIVYAHPVAVRHKMPTEHAFWARYCRRMLGLSNDLWVCQLDGWEESHGMNDEIDTAKLLGIPVTYLSEAQAVVAKYGIGQYE